MALESLFGALGTIAVIIGLLVVLAVIGLISKSTFVYIKPDQIGLVTKNFGKPLEDGQIVAFNGEAGYQAKILLPGWRFLMPFLYSVDKFPILQVPSDSIGIVMSQIGADMPKGAIVATGEGLEAEDFKDPQVFLDKHGQKGIQTITLPIGSTWSTLNPAAFLVKTTGNEIWGLAMSDSAENSLKGMSARVTVIGGGYEQSRVAPAAPVEGRR